MHARVNTAQLKPGSADPFIQIWRSQIGPALKTTKGFKRGFLMGDRSTNQGVVITLWETEADANAAISSSTYTELLGLAIQHFATPPSQEQFEVFVEV